MPNDSLATTKVTIATPTLADAAVMWQLAKESGNLDVNSSYAYVLFCDHFAATSAVARLDGEVIGFVTGFVPPREPSTVLIWQVAVAAEHRGEGVGLALLDAVIDNAGPFRWLKTTIGRSNHASRALFAALADRRQTTCSRTFGYSSDLFPDSHEAEDRCTIGPFGHDVPSPAPAQWKGRYLDS